MSGLLKSRKSFGVFLFVVVFSLVLVACGGSDNNTNNNNATPNTGGNSNDTVAELSGTVTIAGSTSVQPIAEELAHFYMEDVNSKARIEVAGGGSGAGVTAAQSGTADIGMASRAIRDDETGIKPIVIAIDGIAVIAHNDNEVKDITFSQVTDIFSGKITNWSEVGGADQDIVVVIREEGSGTRDAFEDIVLGDNEFSPQAIIQNSTGAVREAVSQDPYAIGFVSVGGINNSVSALSVDGVEATEENIKNNSYTISRPFNFLVGESNDAVNDLTQAFIDYVLSDAGQEVVATNGFVPVN